MEIKLQHEIPGFVEDPTMMFAYPTYLADVFTPRIEQIYLPEQFFPSIAVEVKVTTKLTNRRLYTRKQKFYRELTKPFRDTSTLDCANKFVFDARFDLDHNIAHILENICTPVFFAKKLLSKHLDQQVEIVVLLREKAASLGKSIYQALDIPTICTDKDVYGNVVEVLPDNDRLYSVQPELFNVEIKNYNPTTPERIFVSRRGNRRITNNDEVSQFLETRGFKTCYFEDMTLSEEWSMARNAKAVIAIHGAGSANFIFNRLGLETPDEPGSGLKMIELFTPNFVLPGYRHFGAVLNGRWCAVRGQITPESVRYLDFDQAPRRHDRSPIKDPFKVDLMTLQMALDYLEIR